MKKLFILFSFIFLLLCVRAHSRWHIEVVDDNGEVGQWPSLALDSDDRPHIVYYDTAYHFRYAKKENDRWDIKRSPGVPEGWTDHVTGHTSMTLDNAGNPHVSFGYVEYSDDLYYSCYNGTNWSTPTFIDASAKDNSIAVDSQGKAYIAYHYDQTNGGLYYRTNYDSPPWSQEDIDYLAAMGPSVGIGPSIVISGDDQYLYVSYREYQNIRCKTKYRDDHGPAAWNDVAAVSPDTTTDSKGMITSIAISEDEGPLKLHIAYTNTANGHVMYAYYDGASWHSEQVAPNGGSGLVSIAAKYSHDPHIVYYDSNDQSIKYARIKDGGNWNIEVVDNAAGEYMDEQGMASSIKLDSQGNPHIAYPAVGLSLHLRYACMGEEPELAEDKDVIIGNNRFDPDTGSCRIMYNLSRDQSITIKVYDLTGNLVKTIVEKKHRQQGFHGEDEWDGTSIEYHDVSTGIYYIVVEGDGWKKVSKVAIVKGTK